MHCRSLLAAVNQDTNGEIDFLKVRCDVDSHFGSNSAVNKAKKAPSDKVMSPKLPGPRKVKDKSLENLVDNTINNLQQENNAMKSVGCVSLKKPEGMKKPITEHWLNNKGVKRRTYGRKNLPLVGSESPVLSGEELSGDEEFQRRSCLPLVTSDTGDDKVGRWLDMASQPSVSQRTVSTPLAEKTSHMTPPRSLATLDMSLIPSPNILSPVDTNILRNNKLSDGNKGKMYGIKANDVSLEDTVPYSQAMKAAVEVNDTFDKLVMAQPKHVNKCDEKPSIEFSQGSDGSMPGLLSQGMQKTIMKSLESSEELGSANSDFSFDNIASKKSQGWKKVESSFDEVNKKTNRRQSKKFSLEFSDSRSKPPPDSIIANDANMEIDIGSKDYTVENPDVNSSVDDCFGFSTQDALEGELISNKYVNLVQAQLKVPSPVHGEVKTGEAKRVLPQFKQSNKIPFSLVGRIAPEKPAHRDRIVNFMQLGCLASPRSIKRYNMPTLKTIAKKKARQRSGEVANNFNNGIVDIAGIITPICSGIKVNRGQETSVTKPSNNRTSDQSSLKQVSDGHDKVSIPPPAPVTSGHNNSDKVSTIPPALVTISHDNSDKVSTPSPAPVTSGHDNSAVLPSSLPDNTVTWNINKSNETKEVTKTFMETIIGVNNDVYSQDTETDQERVMRVARLEFEEELVNDSKKRSRDDDDDMEIDVDDSPIKRTKKLSKIDSDTEETPGTMIIAATPERSTSRSAIKTIVARRRSRMSSLEADLKSGNNENLAQSTSLLEPGAQLPSSDTSVISGFCDNKSVEVPTVQHAKEEDVAAKLETVESLFDEETSHFLDKETGSQQLLPATADLVLDTETLNMDQVKQKPSETMCVPDSDDDMFSQTSDGPAPAPPGAKIPELSTVQEETGDFIQEPSNIDTSKWKFVLSNLSSSCRKTAMEFINQLQCEGVSGKMDKTVTHLVVSTGDNYQAQRTLKFLQAVASGVMIVSYKWIAACTKDMSYLGKADQFEALDEELGGINGPFRARKSREEGRKPMMAGFEILIEGAMDDGLDKCSIEDLLSRAGAKVVPTINLFSCTPTITRIVLVNCTDSYGAKNVAKMLRNYRLVNFAATD